MSDTTSNEIVIGCDNQAETIRITRNGQDHTLIVNNHVHVQFCDEVSGCGGNSGSGNSGDGTDNPDGGSGNPGDGTDNPDGGSGNPDGGSTNEGDQNASNPDYTVGVPGGEGFGVGIYPDPATLPTDLTPMDGYDQPSHDNYGNYQHTDGSIMVFVPRFYYRIGSDQSPNYAAYNVNAMDIAGNDTFATTADANAAGYVLHRAFIDGGEEKRGFFFDKYVCSQSADGTKAVSVKGGAPLLATEGNYDPIRNTRDMLPQCTGHSSDAVHVARNRSAGVNVASVFMYSALSMLVIAHTQSSNDSSHCAWFTADGISCPRGQHSTTDHRYDAAVSFNGMAGSGTPFAKTTHNGQNSGISDLSRMDQLMLGVTTFGLSDTADQNFNSTFLGNGADINRLWILKPSKKLGELEGYWGGPTDAWGNERHMVVSYDVYSHSNRPNLIGKWGNGDHPVLSGSQSGSGYISDSLFLPYSAGSLSAEGSDLMARDECGCHASKQNMLLRGCGDGVHTRHTGYSMRTGGHYFRCCLYAA